MKPSPLRFETKFISAPEFYYLMKNKRLKNYVIYEIMKTEI